MTAALTCFELGTYFQKEGDVASALDAFNRAIELDPLAPEYLNHRGLLRYELGDTEGAQQDFEQAVQVEPSCLPALNNLGLIHQTQNQHTLALQAFDLALTLDPTYFPAYCNRGNVFLDEGRLTQALSDFNQAIALKPQESHPYISKSMTCLLRGEYAEGWALNEWRAKATATASAQGATNNQLWLGNESLEGKSILILSEQGLGDSLQFCRYLPRLEQLGAKVTFEVDQSLIRLMQSLSPTISLVNTNQNIPFYGQRFDCYCPLLSLPLALNTTLASIPSHVVPYLYAAPDKVAQWAARLTNQEQLLYTRRPLRVGIAWAGASRPQQLFFRAFNERRDIALKNWATLDMDDLCFYSLQKGAIAQAEHKQCSHLFKHSPLIDLTDKLTDFSETAALIMNLDLVLSVDTSIIHLAGALGQPALLLNRKATCWRWGLEQEKSSWYDSINILRQTQPGDWSGVFTQARQILSQHLATQTTLSNEVPL
jgi:Tfp pilus assembly protein PilF